MISTSLTVLLAVRDGDRARTLAEALRGDDHTVILAHDAMSAMTLAAEHTPHAIILDPLLVEDNGLASRLRQAGGGGPSVILVIGGETAQFGSERDVDYQLPVSFDPLQLSGLIHYVRRTRGRLRTGDS